MPRLGRNVALLAFASFIADVSGEMLMAVLPFVLLAQGAGALGVGLVAGATDAMGHAVKAAGGALADRWHRRKPLILSGYLLAALSRFGIALAPVWGLTLAFRGLDRVGKGLRTAPRDALLAESVAPALRGRAFGLHRTADTAGALVGVALALLLVARLGLDEPRLVLISAVIGLLTLVPLAFVREIEAPDLGRGCHDRSGGSEVADGGASRPVFEPASPRYRAYLVVAAVFALGNLSYMFFLLRAAEVAGGETAALALYLLFNGVYVVGAYPMGALADRWGKPRVLAVGFGAFALSAALLALHPTLPIAVASFVALGVSFASVDGTERAFAADLSGTAGRSTRLGVFHATVGLSTVAGGVVAGLLWQSFGPEWAFGWGALVPLVALALLASGGFLRRGS